RPPEGPEGPTPVEMWRTARLALASGADPLSFYRAVAGFVLRYLRARGLTIEGRRWLDVGAGSGQLAEALARAGGGVVALDVADRRVDGVARTPIVLGRGGRLPFADGSFDGVLSSNVLEHVADPWGMLDELLRVCAPGEVVYL